MALDANCTLSFPLVLPSIKKPIAVANYWLFVVLLIESQIPSFP